MDGARNINRTLVVATIGLVLCVVGALSLGLLPADWLGIAGPAIPFAFIGLGMALECRFDDDPDTFALVATADYSPGQVLQLADGRAGYVEGLNAGALKTGDTISIRRRGLVVVPKTTGQVLLDGAEAWWDHSENKVIYTPGNDRDFFLGTIKGDAASAATECTVNLNARPRPIIDLVRDPFATVLVLSAGTPYVRSQGGAQQIGFSTTAEAQKIDLLSVRSFKAGTPFIAEGTICVVTNADADVADFSFGVANGTHASDPDSITESAFIHLDMGADLNIDAESDDGTTEVNASDTTVDFAVGTPFHVVIDGRDPENLKFYVNGARVISGTTFDISAAAGPLKLLVHLEKSSNDSPGEVRIDRAQLRIMEQAA